MTRPIETDAVAQARDRFLSGDATTDDTGRLSATVRASWQRSRDLRVDTSSPVPAYAPDFDQTNLLRASSDILDELEQGLANEPVVIIITDSQGKVLDCRGGDRELRRQLDRVQLAPGFVYAESAMGTNGIGTALEVGGPALIRGYEHFAENLGVFACAGAPIKHPVNGQLLGVLDITSGAQDANALLASFAKATATRISHAILENASTLERALLDDYYQTSQHSGRPVIALGSRLTIINDHAQRRYSSADQVALLDHVRESLDSRSEHTGCTDLPSGASARLTYRPTLVADQVAGVVIQIQEMSAASHGKAFRPRPAPISLPQATGSSEAWQRVVQTLCTDARARDWTALYGEPGVGKTALVRAVGNHVAPHRTQRILTCSEDSGESLVDELAQSVESAGIVLIRRIDQLPDHVLSEAAALLTELHDLDAHDKPWVAVTATQREEDADPLPGAILPLFARSVLVPPLRLHIEDLPDLTRQLLQTLGLTSLSLADSAIQQLTRLPWPGNVEQLRQLLSDLGRERRSGTITVDDLPPQCRSSTRRRLTPMESLERDAIVRALAAHDGDKQAAAEAIGVSRATIYRKVRSYGIT